jgi:hypothetical protein
MMRRRPATREGSCAPWWITLPSNTLVPTVLPAWELMSVPLTQSYVRHHPWIPRPKCFAQSGLMELSLSPRLRASMTTPMGFASGERGDREDSS